MTYSLLKETRVLKKSKFGIDLAVYPQVGDCGYVIVDTDQGHNEEFYNTRSTFVYTILNGSGAFFLDDEEVKIETGDCISIDPNTKIYYKGKMKLLLITNPAWSQDDEVETKSKVW